MKFSSFPSWKSAVLECLAMKVYSFARPTTQLGARFVIRMKFAWEMT
jgi:hypothetical protein